MKTIEIFGEDRYPEYTKIREGCRGILIRGGKILLSYFKSLNIYMIPGGGIEPGESLEECCKRELGEECGVRVNPHTHLVTLEEYYHEWYFKSHYFICGYLGECESALTENEIKRGLTPCWIDFDKALEIFGSFEKYKDIDEVQYGTYYREYLTLQVLLKL